MAIYYFQIIKTHPRSHGRVPLAIYKDHSRSVSLMQFPPNVAILCRLFSSGRRDITQALDSRRPIMSARGQVEGRVSLRVRGSGCGGSKPLLSTELFTDEKPPPILRAPALPALARSVSTAIAQLSKLDERLLVPIRRRDIALVRTKWLLAQPADFRLLSRQQLEKQMRASPTPLLMPEEAIALIQKGERCVGVVSQCGAKSRFLASASPAPVPIP